MTANSKSQLPTKCDTKEKDILHKWKLKKKDGVSILI